MKTDRFYMCTDQEAVDNIKSAVGSTGFSIQDVSRANREQVIVKLQEGQNIGSVHIRQLLGKACNLYLYYFVFCFNQYISIYLKK